MISICYDSFALACILASLSLPAICTDEGVTTGRPTSATDLVTSTANFLVATTTTADFVTTTTTTNRVVATTTTADWPTTTTTADFGSPTTTTKFVAATTITAGWLTTATTTSHDEVEGSRGSRSPSFEKESSEDMDCATICSEHGSDESDYGEKERWHKSNGTWNATLEHEAVKGEWHRHNGTWNSTNESEGVKYEWEGTLHGSWNGTFEHEAVESEWHRHNGTWNSTFEREGVKHEWEGNPNGTWIGTFEHEAVEGEWHRHIGTWNGTFEREGVQGEWEGSHNGTWIGTFERDDVKGEWEGSRNGTLNKSFDSESGEGKWHRNPNGSWSSHYEHADDKIHESDGTHRSSEDRMAHGTHEGKAMCNCRQRGGVKVSASSSNGQDNGDNGFGNAAILGLAGAGIAALCVASSVSLVLCRRNGKVPLTSASVVFGKSVDNAASSDSGVVAGVVVNNV